MYLRTIQHFLHAISKLETREGLNSLDRMDIIDQYEIHLHE